MASSVPGIWWPLTMSTGADEEHDQDDDQAHQLAEPLGAGGALDQGALHRHPVLGLGLEHPQDAVRGPRQDLLVGRDGLRRGQLAGGDHERLGLRGRDRLGARRPGPPGAHGCVLCRDATWCSRPAT